MQAVPSKPGSFMRAALFILSLLGAAAASAEDLAATTKSAAATNKITQSAVAQGVSVCASQIEQVTTFLGYNPQVGYMLMVSPEQPDQRIVSVAMVSLVDLGAEGAAKTYVVDAPTTLRLLSRRRNPESGATRERFIAMVAAANPTLFASPKRAADVPLGKGTALLLPDDLPTAGKPLEAVATKVAGYVSASFAPNKEGGCGVAYDVVISWPMGCQALSTKKFAALKLYTEFKKEIQILDGDNGTKVFLVPAGSDRCVSIKKEVAFSKGPSPEAVLSRP
jgi:hypothetical protein